MAAIPLFALLVFLIVGEGLKPLEEIAAAIRRRAPTSLEPLPDGGLPEEVRPMVSELNGLLERLREAIETQKRFTADAAHELRSPLTALQLQIQLVERARSREQLVDEDRGLLAGPAAEIQEVHALARADQVLVFRQPRSLLSTLSLHWHV